MSVKQTAIPDILVIEPEVFSDERGFFYESYNENRFFELTGIRTTFVQDNHAISVKGALHGLHYQLNQPQGKLVRAVVGSVFDVAVDLRKSSPTFGRWTGTTLSAANKLQMWIPTGFAHGFLVLSETAEFLYKASNYYAPEDEHAILWNDPSVGIDWPIGVAPPLLSARDQAARLLNDAEIFA